MTASSDSHGFSVTENPEPTPAASRTEILANPGFGVNFTDHMVRIDWVKGEGWKNRRVVPYGPLLIDPANAVLHYGQEIFEGAKAYRHEDGSVWGFRLEENAKRFNFSAHRLAMPELPIEDFLGSVKALIALDKEWVPSAPETSLYLRPFAIADEKFLGVRPAHNVSYILIASPAGAYFAKGVAPVSIWLSETYTRAGRGGMGEAKTGGNYAASLLPQQEAYDNGASQVLFLDSVEGKYIEELGGMNVFFVYKDGRLVTPELSGSILRGITRASILQLARDRGMTVEERKVTIDEWKEGVASGDISEVFASGTAAVVTPIGELKGRDFSVGSMESAGGELTLSLRKELTDIQYGRIADRHGWMTRLDA